MYNLSAPLRIRISKISQERGIPESRVLTEALNSFANCDDLQAHRARMDRQYASQTPQPTGFRRLFHKA